MSGTYAEILLENPASGHGVACGSGNWRLCVEIAIPNQSLMRWDISTWKAAGNALWSDGYEWLDLSSRWRGGGWERGREGLEGRPETGTAVIDLANLDGYLTPWNGLTTFPSPSFLYPGSLVRIGWWDPTAVVYEPAFAGLIRQTNPDRSSENTDADLWCTWELAETTSWLSAVDHPAQELQGLGETSDVRMDRLLDDAEWPFGTDIGGWYAPFDTSTLVDTTMAGNRLAEVYLTADSVFWDAFSDRRGRLATWAKGYSEPWYYQDGSTQVGIKEEAQVAGLFRFLPWAEPPEFPANTEAIINVISVGRVGGTNSASGVNESSVVKYGRSPYRRTDLLVQLDTDLQAWVGFALSVNADNAIKPTAVVVDANMDTKGLEAITRLDIGRSVYLSRLHPRTGQAAAWEAKTFVCHVYGYRVDAVVRSPRRLDVTATLSLVVKAIS